MNSGSLRSPDLASERDTLQQAASLEVATEKFVPLSFSQQQLWYVCQFQSGTIAYNQPVAWRLRGKVNARALEESLNAIILRHEALRTTFPCVEGKPVQCIHRELLLKLQVVDLRKVPESAREAQAHKLATQEAHYRFDLASELLLRATLLRTGDEDYVLVLLVHHIVCDGWSMGILINELAQLYREFSAGRQSTLPIPGAQYSDFTLWQREYMQGENRERQIAYWKKQLDGARSPELPSARPRPAVPSFRGACEFFAFPKSLTEAFKALCAREGVFLFMGLLAIFQTLLHRYTGHDDVVIGSPIAGRKRSRFHGTIGLLLNVVALRTSFSGDPTFRHLLKRARDVVMQGYQHQDLPFEQVVEEVRPNRQPGQNPLFQMLLDQVDARWIAFDLPEIKSEWFPVDHQTAKFDLTFAWFDSQDGLKGWLEYSTDLFEADMIARMLGHFQTLIESAVANPDQPVSRLTLLTAQDRRQLLVEWNETKADYPRDACIHDLFEAQALGTPGAIAVRTDDQHFTFEELNRRANQLSHYLIKLDAGRQMAVGVSLDRNCDLMVALLAVLKTGAAYVPLDPSYPEPRLSFMVKDAGLKTVLTEEQSSGRFASCETRTICLDRDWPEISASEESNPRVPMSGGGVAYVIYTSGSTGRPKGVLGLHRGAVNRFAWMWNKYPFADAEVACAKTAVSFVDSVWELFGPLLAGVPVVMLPHETTRDPSNLIAALARNRVTRLVLVPSLLRAMLEAEPDLQNRLPLLKYWVCSGEALTTDLVNRFRKSVPEGALINLYGSSEVSADVTCYDTREMPPDGPVLIGRPIANTHAYILDATLQSVPIGISGELYVSGDGLALGYLNNPEQTAAKFIPNPFGTNGQARLYRTGDLARYRPDGNIELLGRVDNQVKIRGVRIEPEEIESVLQQHASVAQAVVVAKTEASSDSRLIAYIVPNRSDQISASRSDQNVATDLNQVCKADAALTLAPRLRRYLQERLPDYLVPAAFVTLDALPLMPNGKVDRKALPMPQTDRPNLAQEYVEPRTVTEQKIREAWKEVLQVDRIGTHDNFFDLGGHSLLLVTVQNKLAKAFNRDILSVDLYRYPTIRSLAEHLDGRTPEPRALDHARERGLLRKESLQHRRAILAARLK